MSAGLPGRDHGGVSSPPGQDLSADDGPTDAADEAEGPKEAAGPADVTAAPAPDRGARVKAVFTALGLLALFASAIVGANLFGLRGRVFGSARPEPRPAAVSRTADAPTATTAVPQKTVLRSQPWWQGVTTIEGAGPMMPTFDIATNAVQWRVKWTCQAGHLTVTAPPKARAVADAGCPGTGTGYGTATGKVGLQVQVEGPWKLQVEQQVDVPLNEPPLPAMTAPGAVKVAAGSFYRIDQVGTGTVTLFRLADRTYAIRLDDFFVTANSELEIRLSSAEEPKTSAQFLDAPSVAVTPLEVTVGSLNFTLPADIDPAQYKSVVIWCQRIDSAYSAATLRPVQ